MRRCAAVLTLSLSLAAPTSAQLSALETDHLRLVYLGATESYLTPHAARTFENARLFHRRLFSLDPPEKITVLLTDFSDQGNAGAGAVPRDFVGVQIAPLGFAYETMSSNERLNTIMNHELVHVATMDGSARSDRAFRRIFGGKVMPIAEHPESVLYFYLTAPRVAVPRWYQEGIAVFMETWMAGGIGRAQSGYDEMVFRAMVKDGSRFYDPLGLASEGTKADFQVEMNSYLYGARFLTYLAWRHSPEHVVRAFARTDGTKAYYASEFERVFGQPLETAWAEWIEFERDFQVRNLEAVREYPTTPYQDLSKRALGSVSRAFVDEEARKLYAAFNYPGVAAHVGAISLRDGSLEKIVDVKGPVIFNVTSLAFDPETKTIFFTADNGAHRDLMAVDPRTKRSRMLLKDVRVGDLAYNRTDRSLWGIRLFNGICTLVRIPQPYREWNRVHSWPYGEIAYDLDLSPDGRLLSASFAEVSGKHTLRLWDTEALLAGDAEAQAQVGFGTATPLNFVFSPDGRFLYGSSYYSGVSNVFRYEVATGAMEAMSNTETGFFRPIPLGDDRLVVFRFTGEGFLPATIDARPVQDVSAIHFLGHELAEKHPVVKEWMLGSPARLPFEPRLSGSYQPARSLGLESFYPIVEGYKEFAALGVRLNYSDPVQLNRASLDASYTPDGDLAANERLHLHAEYARSDWRFQLRWNAADFYDLFGPTRVSRKGYAAGLGWDKLLVYDVPREMRLGLRAEYSGGLDQLPEYQNVSASVGRLVNLRGRLSYKNTRGSLGKVDQEKGQTWTARVDYDNVDGRSFVRAGGDLDLGFALPLEHSSLWLRSSAGLSPNAREEPYANFFFGGFGNNWVDHREEKRYRESHSFPGLELNELGGRNYLKSALEWNLPPLRFRRVGRPGFYANWLRPAVFVSGLVTDLDAAGARLAVANLGAQIDVRLNLLSVLDLTLSAGHALAWQDGVRPRHETMVSLKLLR